MARLRKLFGLRDISNLAGAVFAPKVSLLEAKVVDEASVCAVAERDILPWPVE